MLHYWARSRAIALALAVAAALCLLLGVGVMRAAPVTQETPTPEPADNGRPPGWTDASHSNDVDPNYDVVFPVDAVNRMTITIDADGWAAMQADLLARLGPRIGLDWAAAVLTGTERLTGTALLEALEQARVEAAGGEAVEAVDLPDNPIWETATIEFGGQTWTNVGIRHKGTASLQAAWEAETNKLPFKFDFDEFEDDYPAIKNQRFFGFKELSLAPNHDDATGMRDMLFYDLLEAAGQPAMAAAPYEIILDIGDGPVSLGLYTLIEVVDDTGITHNFGSDDGNIYEAVSIGASFAVDKVQHLVSSLEKKNNEDSGWGDAWDVYAAVHDGSRLTNPETWRADLEAVFDVDAFLSWLALSSMAGHVDTYGYAAHNFYLYNDPATGKLTWISWDHNYSFYQPMLWLASLDRDIVDKGFPLIRFLFDDPVYHARYVELMGELFSGALEPQSVIERIESYAALLQPTVAAQGSTEEFDAAVAEMIQFVENRAVEIEAYLAANQ